MSVVSSLLLLLLGCVNCVVLVNSFVLPASSSSAAKASVSSLAASPLADDALASYPYAFKSSDSEEGGLWQISEAQAVKAFDELARLYGDEAALDMVKIQPLALATNPDNFGQTLDVWTETFGLEMAQGMVKRNPGLLLIKPKLAETDAAGAMAWSFVIWATRPVISKLAIAAYAFYQYDSVVSAGEDFFPWSYEIVDTGAGIKIIGSAVSDSLLL